MPEPTYPAVIDTLGRLIDHGLGAFMLCPTCLRAGRPDVRDIDLGRDWHGCSRSKKLRGRLSLWDALAERV